MKKITTTIAILLTATLLGTIQFGCVKEDFDRVPPFSKEVTWNKTVTIAQLKTLFTNNGQKAGVLKDLPDQTFWDNLKTTYGDTSMVINATVISCDSAANFYKTVTLTDETGGIDLKINAYDLYLTYGLKPGRRVLVKVNSLTIDSYHGLFQLGEGYYDGGSLKITGYNPNKLSDIIQLSGEEQSIEPTSLAITEIRSEHVQTLVKINNVQFWNPVATFSLPGVNTNRTLIDPDGNQLILRTSGYAKFMSQTVPSGSGSITGVLGVYDGTYQLVIRNPDDILFENDRFGDSAPEKNTTIAELKALCTSNLVPIPSGKVIEGIVLANDESGNLYKQLFIEDETGAIEFKINVTGLYSDFPVGTKIVVNCNGLYLGKYGGVVQLGGIYNGSIGRLDASIFYKNVFIISSGNSVSNTETTVKSLTSDMIGKLVTLSDVQFVESEMGKTYAEGSTTNRHLEDAEGNTIIVRTSSYADFAGTTLPDKRGTFTAVLSKYNSDYQLYIRDLSDINMKLPRRVKNYLLNEDFSSATVGQPININGWQSIAVSGTKQWIAKQYSGNTYAEMNPYRSSEASNIGWLISPKITLEQTNTYLTFETEYSYWADSKLEVFVSTDYNGSDPQSATWTPLPDAYIVQQSDGYNNWVGSGMVSLSGFSGDIYIGFKYTGGGTIGQTTAFRVDNVNIFFTQE